LESLIINFNHSCPDQEETKLLLHLKCLDRFNLQYLNHQSDSHYFFFDYSRLVDLLHVSFSIQSSDSKYPIHLYQNDAIHFFEERA